LLLKQVAETITFQRPCVYYSKWFLATDQKNGD